jgi:hypothetical protein
MKFKINDIIILNNCDTKQLIGTDGSTINIYKTTVFRVKRLINEEGINIETMYGTEIFGNGSVDLFRLATELEVKTDQMKNLF